MLHNNVVVGVMTEAACEREGERIEAKLLLLLFFYQKDSPKVAILRGNWITSFQRLSKEILHS